MPDALKQSNQCLFVSGYLAERQTRKLCVWIRTVFLTFSTCNPLPTPPYSNGTFLSIFFLFYTDAIFLSLTIWLLHWLPAKKDGQGVQRVIIWHLVIMLVIVCSFFTVTCFYFLNLAAQMYFLQYLRYGSDFECRSITTFQMRVQRAVTWCLVMVSFFLL